jgi:hypothetical protein
LPVWNEDIGHYGLAVDLLNTQQLNAFVLGFRGKLLECQVSVWPRQELDLDAKPSF